MLGKIKKFRKFVCKNLQVDKEEKKGLDNKMSFD